MSDTPWSPLVESLAASASRVGLDLAAPLCVGWYNDAVPPEYAAPDFGNPASLGVVLGNTRKLWPAFIDACRGSTSLRRSPDPLDDYVMTGLSRVVDALPVRTEVRHAHEAPPRRVAMQRLAVVAGLAPLSPSMMSVHPVFGPWIALRALVVMDVEGPAGHGPKDPALICAGECERCCLPAFEAALGGRSPEELGGYGAPEVEWERWLAVRDACPAGREHRYGDEQVRYHYTKGRSILEKLLAGPA